MPGLSDMDIKELYVHAGKIPSLGDGGFQIRGHLIRYVLKTRENYAIIEIGPWLGSATAYICIGILAAHSGREYHVYDKWEAVEPYLSRAKKFNGLNFNKPDSIYETFCGNVDIFGVDIVKHRQDILTIKWDVNKKIGLYVDDFGSRKEYFNYKMETFLPAFIPGQTILMMMDYFFYETHKDEDHKNQKKYFESNKDKFEFIERAGKRCAIFKYK